MPKLSGMNAFGQDALGRGRMSAQEAWHDPWSSPPYLRCLQGQEIFPCMLPSQQEGYALRQGHDVM